MSEICLPALLICFQKRYVYYGLDPRCSKDGTGGHKEIMKLFEGK